MKETTEKPSDRCPPWETAEIMERAAELGIAPKILWSRLQHSRLTREKEGSPTLTHPPGQLPNQGFSIIADTRPPGRRKRG